jgi:hypothetical protein
VKVISFKDIEVIRVVRTTKEVIKNKEKWGQKYKSSILEVNKVIIEVEREVARATKEVITGKGKRSRKRKKAI